MATDDIPLSDVVADDLFPGDGDPPEFESDLTMRRAETVVDGKLGPEVTLVKGDASNEVLITTQEPVEVRDDAR